MRSHRCRQLASHDLLELCSYLGISPVGELPFTVPGLLGLLNIRAARSALRSDNHTHEYTFQPNRSHVWIAAAGLSIKIEPNAADNGVNIQTYPLRAEDGEPLESLDVEYHLTENGKPQSDATLR